MAALELAARNLTRLGARPAPPTMSSSSTSALEMDREDAVIRVHSLEDERLLAFIDFGVESLVAVIDSCQ